MSLKEYLDVYLDFKWYVQFADIPDDVEFLDFKNYIEEPEYKKYGQRLFYLWSILHCQAVQCSDRIDLRRQMCMSDDRQTVVHAGLTFLVDDYFNLHK